MEIGLVANRPSHSAGAKHFSGTVKVAEAFSGGAGQRGTRISFHAGAHTVWHAHSAGMTLLVIEGRGLAQRDGVDIESMLPGDAIWFEPGTRQWHGAAPDQGVTLIALTHTHSDVVWMEPVSRENA